MICTPTYDYPVEKYKDYKNRTFNKHLDKIKNQIQQIKSCSLKGEDKIKLKEQILQLLLNQLT